MNHAPSRDRDADRRWLAWIALAMVLLALGTGIWAYRQDDKEGSWSDAVFKTMQLFHLHFQPCHMNGEEVTPLSLHVARFAAAAVGLGLLPAMLVVVLFHGDLLRWRVRYLWRGHTIVCGHCARTRALADDLRRQGRRVVLLGDHPPDAVPVGVLQLGHSTGHADLLGGTAVHRAAALVALHEEDRVNLELLCAADECCRRRRLPRPLETHAHLQDLHLRTGLNQVLTSGSGGDGGGRTRHHVFNYYEIVARLFACQYPLPETLNTRLPLPTHYVVVGFGSFGQNVVLKLVKVGQQLLHLHAHGSDRWQIVKPRVTVVDRRGDIAAAQFLRAYPQFTEHCEFRVLAADCESPGFLDLPFAAPADAKAPVSIIFCLEDETVTLRTLLLLRSVCAKPDKNVDAIYIRLARPEQLGPVFEKLSAGLQKPKITTFAPNSEVFTTDAVLRVGLDALARKVHEAYLSVAAADARANNLAPAAGRSWDELAEEDRDSNREAADHTWAKLRTLGYCLERVTSGAAAPPDGALIDELAAREDELARAEHYRWMTWRLLSGWRHGDERDNANKLHPDIKRYEELLLSTQEKDKVIIRAIPQLLLSGRLRARRMAAAAPRIPAGRGVVRPHGEAGRA